MSSSSDTKFFESAQALFCAVVDYLGKPIVDNKRPPNYSAFKEQYGNVIKRVERKVRTGAVTIKNIEDFLTIPKNQEWYDSSINVANELFRASKIISRKTFNKIKPPSFKFINILYQHGIWTVHKITENNTLFYGLTFFWPYQTIYCQPYIIM